MKSKYFTILLLFVALGACTINRETTIYHAFEVENQKICVIENKNIKYPQFTGVLLNELEKKGFKPSLVTEELNCPLTLKYTADWEWDMAYYLTDVNLDIYSYKKQMANSKYHVTGGKHNGLLWYKYRRSITILGQMLDELRKKLEERKL